MPTPGKRESESDFISRCMAFPDLQGKDQKQRAGECYGIWREHHQKAITSAIEHLENASQFGHGEMSERDYKSMQAAHQYHAKCLKEYLRDTEGNQVHHDTGEVND